MKIQKSNCVIIEHNKRKSPIVEIKHHAGSTPTTNNAIPRFFETPIPDYNNLPWQGQERQKFPQ
jgi:hypothetical protein